ncbi:MAG: hypothetical protein ACKO2D_03765 [Chloroflexota bacterium]|jgi:hypothetical protein|nr:hypothetical protein [Chloroflexota bacterium]
MAVWDWYSRPGDWRTRGGRRTGLLISIGLSVITGAVLFMAAVAIAASMLS